VTMRPTSLFVLSLAALSWGLVACGDDKTGPSAGHDAYVSPDVAPLSCAPDLDGTLTAKELPTVLDTPASYLINPAGKDRTVDVAGIVAKDGVRTWSFGVDFADDQTLSVTATRVAGKWYAPSFPEGQFVTPQDAGATLDAIYERDDAGVYLLGIASTTEAPADGKTLVVYEKPILVAKLPLSPGQSWISSSDVTNATIKGLPYAGKDTYEVTDDATGRLVTHDFTFDQVHRVRTKVTISPSAGKAVTRRQVSFFTECLGEVVRAVSQNDEPNADFTDAAELRRLGN
jgi:hypothetical protein